MLVLGLGRIVGPSGIAYRVGEDIHSGPSPRILFLDTSSVGPQANDVIMFSSHAVTGWIGIVVLGGHLFSYLSIMSTVETR